MPYCAILALWETTKNHITHAGRERDALFSRLSLAMSGGMYELLQVKTMEEYTRFCVTP